MKGLAATTNGDHHLAQTPRADDAGHPTNPADHLLINHRGTILYLRTRDERRVVARGAHQAPTQRLGLGLGLGGLVGVALADGPGETLGEALGEALGEGLTIGGGTEPATAGAP